MNTEFVVESYISIKETTFKTCASFSGVIHATFLNDAEVTKDNIIPKMWDLYPTFKDLPMFVALLPNGVIAFSHEHPDFKSNVVMFNTLDEKDGYGIAISQPGAVGLWSLNSRQSENYTEPNFERIVPDGGGEVYLRIFKKNYFEEAGEAIEISYSPKFKMVSVVVPSCVLVEFGLGLLEIGE